MQPDHRRALLRLHRLCDLLRTGFAESERRGGQAAELEEAPARDALPSHQVVIGVLHLGSPLERSRAHWARVVVLCFGAAWDGIRNSRRGIAVDPCQRTRTARALAFAEARNAGSAMCGL